MSCKFSVELASMSYFTTRPTSDVARSPLGLRLPTHPAFRMLAVLLVGLVIATGAAVRSTQVLGITLQSIDGATVASKLRAVEGTYLNSVFSPEAWVTQHKTIAASYSARSTPRPMYGAAVTRYQDRKPALRPGAVEYRPLAAAYRVVATDATVSP